MKHLEKLNRKMRFDPRMGGNTEAVTLPCTFVSRLIGMALAWQSLETGRDLIPILKDMDQEAVWADDECRAILDRGLSIERRQASNPRVDRAAQPLRSNELLDGITSTGETK
jgi:hypothetical protein